MMQSRSSTSFFTRPPRRVITCNPLPVGYGGKRPLGVDAPGAARHNGPVSLPWDGLDEAWREAFRQAWEAVRTGNIGVGACASTLDGEIIHAARNRVNDQ